MSCEQYLLCGVHISVINESADFHSKQTPADLPNLKQEKVLRSNTR